VCEPSKPVSNASTLSTESSWLRLANYYINDSTNSSTSDITNPNTTALHYSTDPIIEAVSELMSSSTFTDGDSINPNIITVSDSTNLNTVTVSTISSASNSTNPYIVA